MPANQPHPGEFTPKIDLNHATRDELMQIPGISAKTADKLIEYRDEELSPQKGESPTPEPYYAERDRSEDELIAHLYI